MVRMLKVALKDGKTLLFGESNKLESFNLIRPQQDPTNEVLFIAYIEKVGDIEIGTQRYIEMKYIQGFIYSDVEIKSEEKPNKEEKDE